VIAADPITEAAICAGEATVAPSLGEVITTAVAELGVDAGALEAVPAAVSVPPVALPAALPPAAAPELELPAELEEVLAAVEPAEGVEEALPVVEPAEESLPPVEEPPLTRAGVVKVPAEF